MGERMSVEVDEVAGLIRVLGRPIPLRLLNLVWSEALCVEFCARVLEVDAAQISRDMNDLWQLGLLMRWQQGHWVFHQRARGRLHPVFWQFLRLARTMALGSKEVSEDRHKVETMRRGEGAELVADLPWPKQRK